MMMNMMRTKSKHYSDDKIRSNNVLNDLLTSFKVKVNNLKDFKAYLDSNKNINK